MARPKKNTEQVTCRLNVNLVAKLKLINPAITTRDASSGKIKFRYGALGSYIARLIQEDVEKREKLLGLMEPTDILDKFRGDEDGS